jgi:hypothetical protein
LPADFFCCKLCGNNTYISYLRFDGYPKLIVPENIEEPRWRFLFYPELAHEVEIKYNDMVRKISMQAQPKRWKSVFEPRKKRAYITS